MKKIIYPLVFFLLSKQASGQQSLSKNEKLLAYHIIKECGYSSSDDSLRVFSLIEEIHLIYKVRRVRFVHNGTASSHFAFGTVHLNESDSVRMCDVWVGEIAHAVQFSLRPVFYAKLALGDFFKTFMRTFSLTKKEKDEVRELRDAGCSKLKAKLWVAYRRQYHSPGSLEYIAHKEIEPVIRQYVAGALASR